MWRGESLSIERGRWKCSGISVSMASALSEITDIYPESDRYAEKALCDWYDMHAPGSGTKRCWVPKLSYFGSESEEKAISRFIVKMFQNMEAKYIVGTFL